MAKITIRLKGGPGSGHYGHTGRPGKVGGSSPGKSGPLGKSELLPLAHQAMHYNNFKDFENDYKFKNYHGLYWHLTNDPNFIINPKQAPRDASTMASIENATPGLMITTDIGSWDDTLGGRTHAVLIDLSNLKPNADYRHVTRGFGHEIFVFKPSKAKITGVYPLEEAYKMTDKHYSETLPGSKSELLDVYNWAHANL